MSELKALAKDKPKAGTDENLQGEISRLETSFMVVRDDLVCLTGFLHGGHEAHAFTERSQLPPRGRQCGAQARQLRAQEERARVEEGRERAGQA